MERPTEALARRTTVLAEKVARLSWAAENASLAEVTDGLTDSDVLALAGEIGTIKNLVDATAARVAGVVA